MILGIWFSVFMCVSVICLSTFATNPSVDPSNLVCFSLTITDAVIKPYRHDVAFNGVLMLTVFHSNQDNGTVIVYLGLCAMEPCLGLESSLPPVGLEIASQCLTYQFSCVYCHFSDKALMSL